MTTAMAVRQDRGWSPAGILVAAATGSLAMASLVLAVADWASPSPASLAGLSAESSNTVEVMVQTVGLFTLAATASFVVWRQPRNVFGWVLAATVISLSVWIVAEEYAVYGLVIAVGSLPLADTAAMFQKVMPDLVATGAIAAILVFPDGRLKSVRWLLVIVAAGLVTLLSILSSLSDQSELLVGFFTRQYVPAYVPPALWPVGEMFGWASTAFIWGVVPALIAAVGVVMRMAASRGEARLQLQWFAWAAALYVIAGLLSLANEVGLLGPPLSGFSPSGAAWAVTGWARIASGVAGMILVPIAIGIAVARYRLYDIDVVINRTIIYGGLALFVTGGYAIVVGGVGGLLGQRAGLNPVLSVLTIALLAILLLPVRSRLDDLADLAVYGKRARPYDVLSDFAESIGHAESAGVLLPRMAELLRQGTAATGTEVWARVGDGLQLAAASPPIDTPAAVADAEQIGKRHMGAASVEPVFHDGRMLGALVVVKPRGEDLTAVERRLFRDVASHAGLVLTRFRLVQELRESRARIVASQDIERHRIERNLHDGAQQHFVTALLSLGMAQAEGEHNGSQSDFLAEASREVQAGLNELRSLARGLQPPLLGESGIVAASTALADAAPIATTVVARFPDRRYPQGIETAAYFMISESLTNAAKHSRARNVTVTIDEGAGRLSIEVRDDGVGGAEISDGSGIIGLQDRVAAVGGRLTVESPEGGGTVVRAELPCA